MCWIYVRRVRLGGAGAGKGSIGVMRHSYYARGREMAKMMEKG